MELREGYKNTEVGVIPDDWEVKTYGEVFDFLATANYSRAELTEIDNVRYVHYGDIHTKWNFFLNIRESNLPTVRNEQVKNYHLLKDGDVIMADASEDYSGIGKSVEVKNLDSVKAISGLHTFLFRDKNEIFVNGFKGYIHFSKAVKNQFDRLATGLKVYGVSKGNLKTVQIPVPTKAEQTAIATALSDTDALISSLEKLIAKKRYIKQGAMQKLLQPKEGWEVKKLGEIAVFRRGSFPQPYGLDKWYDDISGYPFIQVFDVDDNKKLKPDTKRHISKEAQPYSVFVKKGSIVLTIQGSIGRIAITHYDAYVDRTLLLFEEFKVEFDNYFFMLLIHILFEKEKETAPGGIIKTITKAALTNFVISYPKSKEEQTRIATILSDMDAEIIALETKLEKYKMIKLGMMQNLLTGKIRLI